MTKEQTKCVAVNLTQSQLEQVKAVKEHTGESQNELLAQCIMHGLKKFEDLNNHLFWVKVRIDPSKMMEFGQKLQSGELKNQMIKFTYCLKDDPTVGISLWEAKDKQEFEAFFNPHKYYYKEVIEISQAVTPEEAMQLILKLNN